MKENGCLVTVAVPVFNGEKKIKRCICSIQSQLYNNLEIIVINDGSTDSTAEIVYELQKEDDRIFLVNIQNGGVANARNQALLLARGKYICFVDADDYILPQHIQAFMDNEEDENTLIISAYQSVDEDELPRKECDNQKKIHYLPKTAELEMFYGYKLGNYCWDKMYSMNFIRKHNLAFDTLLKIGEDTAFVNAYVRRCTKVVFLGQATYVHEKNRGSVMEGLLSNDRAWEYLYEAIKVSRAILESESSAKVRRAITASIVQAQEHLLRIMCVRNIENDIYRNELKSFKRDYLKVLTDDRVDIRQKIKILVMGINPMRREFYKMWYRI